MKTLPKDLTHCTRPEAANLFGVELAILDAWLERGAPVVEDEMLHFGHLAGWIMGEQPSPDTDPSQLPGEATAALCSALLRAVDSFAQQAIGTDYEPPSHVH